MHTILPTNKICQIKHFFVLPTTLPTEKKVGRLVLLMFFGRQDGGQDEKLLGRLVLLFIFGRQDGGQDPAYRKKG